MSEPQEEIGPVEAAHPSGEVTVEMVVDADVDDVWRALTTPSGLATWLGRDAAMDPVERGALTAPDPASGEAKRGEVLSVRHGSDLRFRWWPENRPDTASTVHISLEPAISGTRIRVTETLDVPRAACGGATASATFGAWMWRISLVAFGLRLALV